MSTSFRCDKKIIVQTRRNTDDMIQYGEHHVIESHVMVLARFCSLSQGGYGEYLFLFRCVRYLFKNGHIVLYNH